MIKIRLLYEQIIKEIGDLENIETYKFSNNKFITEDNLEVRVEFREFNNEELGLINVNTSVYPPPIFNVIFNVGGVESQFYKTDLKKYLKILKTVTLICHKFITTSKPNGLIFFSANKDDKKFLYSDPQKNKIYKLIVMNQIIKNGGFKLVNLLPFGNYEGFMIYKNN